MNPGNRSRRVTAAQVAGVVLQAFLLSSTIAYGRMVKVSVGATHRSGEVWLSIGKIGVTCDTVHFDNGPMVSVLRSVTGTMENGECRYALFLVPGTYTTAGIRCNDSAITAAKEFTDPTGAQFTMTITTGNPDSIWSRVLRYPECLRSLDTAVFNDPGRTTPVQKRAGKWCFTDVWSTAFLGCQPNQSHPDGNFNALLYVADPSHGHMKLQVAAFSRGDDTACGVVYANCRIDQMLIRWASDSAGNLQFEPSSAIRSAPSHGVRRIRGFADREGPQFRDRKAPGRDKINGAVFDAKGSAVNHDGGIGTNRIAAGCYLRRTDD